MQTGFRSQPSEQLLRDFDKTAELVRSCVADRYGEEGADELCRDARKKYEESIPWIPRIPGLRARVLNTFLRGTAQEVAVYKAVQERGGTPAEAWEVCHEAIRLRMNGVPKWKRRLFRRFLFSGVVRWIVRRREQNKKHMRLGDFEIRYLTGDGTAFDIGVDYVRCGNLELAKKLGAEEFAPYVCMSDIALSDALGWGLTRTQTLADGCSHCDFRFKRDAPTRISSRTPEVQETIERIGRRSHSARARKMTEPDRYLQETQLLDYRHPALAGLVTDRGWAELPAFDRIAQVYDFVQNEIAFGYNQADDIVASQVLADGYGQCNTKGTLLMALLRSCGIPCRFHGFTIDKALQKGAITGIAYRLAPRSIIHSWVEVLYDGNWVNLEGFILDQRYLHSIQARFATVDGPFCGYGVATQDLKDPPVEWQGRDTYIQRDGINHDYGVFDSPDDFYRLHGTNLAGINKLIYSRILRHSINRNVTRLRQRDLGDKS